MNKIFVSGLINIEISVPVNGFPINYQPINFLFNEIDTCIGGVGYNVSKALKTLGDKVVFSSIIANDLYGNVILNSLKKQSFDCSNIQVISESTPKSVVLFDKTSSKREIYCDLSNLQSQKLAITNIDNDIDLAILCNINFNRDLLKQFKEKNILIASDVHVISSIDDEYNKDFIKYSDILFLSDELISYDYKQFIANLQEKYQNNIIVLGRGENGCYLKVKGKEGIDVKSITTRKVVNTIGAGDALFSSFLHFYLKTKDPYISIKKATYFASYKIGSSGATNGFLSEKELDNLINDKKFDLFI